MISYMYTAYDFRNDILTSTLSSFATSNEVGMMVKDHLYQISQFCCVDIVITNVILQNVFAQ